IILLRFNLKSDPESELTLVYKFSGVTTRRNGFRVHWYGDTEDDGKDKCVSIIDDDTFPKHKFSLSIPVSVKNPRRSLLGSSQGLFCFYRLYNSQFVLWNPTIKKSVAIDLPTNDDELDILPDHRTSIGFGVCPKTHDAKLVKITSENPFVSITNVIQVEVYTLSSRVWRILASSLPQKSLLFLDWVDVGGFIYWFAQDSVSRSYLIMSFDLTSEVFTELSLPDCLTSNDDNYVFLSKLGDSLVLLEGNNWDMHVWIMRNGDPKSFTRLYTIDMPAENIVFVLGFRKSGEPIIEIKRDKKESEIIVYEPNTYQIRYTGIVGQLGTFFASSYIETLLLLDHEDNDNVVECGAFKRQCLE
ncbi:putative F-box domain-containing protein, partial [Tanacetum coccineum]